MAHTCLLPYDTITEKDIMTYLLMIIFPDGHERSTYNYKIQLFFEEIHPRNFYQFKCVECTEWRYEWVVIRNCIRILNHATINDIDDEGYLVPIIRLDDPNDKILPVLRQKVALIGEYKN